MDSTTWMGLLALCITLAAIVAAFCVWGAWLILPWFAARRTIRNDYEVALVEDSIRDELEVVAKRVHYRHSIHCPMCGRFTRQAPGFPEGVADCIVHGIHLRTGPDTGPILVIVQPVGEGLAPPETSPLYLDRPAEGVQVLQ